jgi:hypothetical protein
VSERALSERALSERAPLKGALRGGEADRWRMAAPEREGRSLRGADVHHDESVR